jgi:hypothetical protein
VPHSLLHHNQDLGPHSKVTPFFKQNKSKAFNQKEYVWAQTRLVATILLGFLAYHEMSKLSNNSRMAREAQSRPETCYTVYGRF